MSNGSVAVAPVCITFSSHLGNWPQICGSDLVSHEYIDTPGPYTIFVKWHPLDYVFSNWDTTTLDSGIQAIVPQAGLYSVQFTMCTTTFSMGMLAINHNLSYLGDMYGDDSTVGWQHYRYDGGIPPSYIPPTFGCSAVIACAANDKITPLIYMLSGKITIARPLGHTRLILTLLRQTT
jgi:hypothetical protein